MRLENPLELASTFLEFSGSRVADPAPTGKARLFFDATVGQIRFSANGAAYASLGAAPRLQDLTEFTIPFSPTASTSLALLALGPTQIASGSAQGTYLGINAAAGYAGDLVNFQVAGARKLLLTADGFLGLGTQSPGTTSALRFLFTSATLLQGAFCEVVSTLAGGTVRGGRFASYVNNASGDLVGIGVSGSGFFRGSSATSSSLLAGGDFSVGTDAGGTGGTVTEAAGIRINVTNPTAGATTTTFTAAEGLLVKNQGAGHGVNNLTITNSYGIRVSAQSGAATKSWGIVSEGGECQILTGAVGTKGLSIQAFASQTGNLFETQNSSGTPQLQITSGHGIFSAGALSIQTGGNTAISLGNGSGTAMLRSVQVTPQNSFAGTSGNQTNLEVLSTFAPASGTATFQGALITQTINQTGGANGIYHGLSIAVTETAAAAVFHKLIGATVGGAVRFAVGNDGRLYSGVPTTAPTDGNLANSQISWWLDEAVPAVKARIKKSDGTLLTLTIANGVSPTLA